MCTKQSPYRAGIPCVYQSTFPHLTCDKPFALPAGKTLEVRRSEAADAQGKATTPEQLRRIFYTAVEDRRRATVGLRPLPKPAPPPAPPSEERTKEILADDRVQVGQQSTLCCMLACAWVMCCRCSHLAVVWLMICPHGLSVVLYKSFAAHPCWSGNNGIAVTQQHGILTRAQDMPS